MIPVFYNLLVSLCKVVEQRVLAFSVDGRKDVLIYFRMILYEYFLGRTQGCFNMFWDEFRECITFGRPRAKPVLYLSDPVR